MTRQTKVDDVELLDTTATPDRREPVVEDGRGWSVLAAVLLLGFVGAFVVLVVDDGQTPESASPPVVQPRAQPPLEIAAGNEPGDGPVLGRMTGLSLMVGGADTPLRVLDLDTGDLTVGEAMLAPQFLSGSSLIYVSDAQTWAHAPLDEFREAVPGDLPGVRFSPIGAPARVLPADSTTVWLTWPRFEGGRYWQLIDLVTSEVVREVTTPAEARILGGTDPFLGPEVISSRNGGVFELQGDGSYERRLEGTLIAVGAEDVLVRDCSIAIECTTAWYSRTDWLRTDRPIPMLDLANGRLVAGGRLLAGFVPRAPLGAELYDMSTGEIVRAIGPEPLRSVSVSPDGAWLVRQMLGRVEVVEIATGASTVVPNLPLGRDDSIIWFESA